MRSEPSRFVRAQGRRRRRPSSGSRVTLAGLLCIASCGFPPEASQVTTFLGDSPDDRALACTGFVLQGPAGPWVGKNLDWAVSHGVVAINQRGVRKIAWHPHGESDLSWVSRYGSVTFNQLGWGFPLGGLNEAGLVVEEMSYSPTRYPDPDSRPSLNELQWIQYQLDNHSAVAEVLASDTEIRIEPFLVGLHYLVADRNGNVAVVEFLDGTMTAYTDENLPVPVLANDTYANSVKYLRHHVGFGGERTATNGPESPERFVRAATQIREYEREVDPGDPGKRTLEILDSVRQSDTQWTMAYGLAEGAVSFRTLGSSRTRTLGLDSWDFACREGEASALPLDDDNHPWSGAADQRWTLERNEALVTTVFEEFGEIFTAEELPSPEVISSLATYLSSEKCGTPHQ